MLTLSNFVSGIVGALAVLFVTQGFALVRGRWMAPHLTIELDRARLIPWIVAGGGLSPIICPAHWFHLVVTNRGRSVAVKTQILVNRVPQKRGEELIELRGFLPMCLQWTNSGDPPKVEIDLLTDFSRRANLAHVDGPCSAGGRASKFALCTEVNPSNGCNLLAPGTYELQLLVAAENFKPKLHRVRIECSDVWHDDIDEFSRQTAVKLL
jgi:hypothetical protein